METVRLQARTYPSMSPASRHRYFFGTALVESVSDIFDNPTYGTLGYYNLTYTFIILSAATSPLPLPPRPVP